MELLAGVYKRSRDPRAKHYMINYSTPVLPPIWALKEFLTFGSAAKFYQMLSNRVRADVALRFGVRKEELFTNWVLASSIFATSAPITTGCSTDLSRSSPAA